MPSPELQQIVEAIRAKQRFVISSHSRPDGDSIGSQLAAAYALRALGKQVTVVNADPAPPPLMQFPGVPDIQIADRVESSRRRRGRHHHGVRRPGAHRRRGPRAVFRHQHRSSSRQYVVRPVELVRRDARPRAASWSSISSARSTCRCRARSRRTSTSPSSPTPARSITRAFRRGPSTSAGEALEAGVDPVLVARNVYDSNNMGRLKLFGAVLSAMQIDPTGRIAIVYLDHEMARQAGGTYEDTEGLINLPLTVKEIQAVVFFKQTEGDEYRVSMRSKGDIDIGSVAKEFGGGGHKNAAGCTVTGPDRRAAEDVHREDRASHRCRCRIAEIDWTLPPAICNLQFCNPWTACSSSTSPRPDLARRRRPRAARAWRAAHRPHRHARSGRDRRAAARARPRHAARTVSERERQVVRGGRPPRRRDRHVRWRGDAGRPVVSGRAAVTRGDRSGARRVPRNVSAAAARVLGEEDRRPAQLQRWRARQRAYGAGAAT